MQVIFSSLFSGIIFNHTNDKIRIDHIFDALEIWETSRVVFEEVQMKAK